MKRRAFLQVLSAGLASNYASALLLAQPAKPKLMFFGMTIVQNGSEGALRLLMPSSGGHATFIVSWKSIITQLGGKPIDASGAGLSNGHPDLVGPLWMWCLEGKQVKVGTGVCTLQPALEARLPKLLDLATQIQPGTVLKIGASPAGSVVADLGAGRLRTPGTPSSSTGTHSNVMWQFFNGTSPIGAKVNLTDLAVFESELDNVDISVGGPTISVPAGVPIWIINVPILALEDKTPQKIEHAHDWFSVLTPTVNATHVTAETTDTVSRPPCCGKYSHPCEMSREAMARAKSAIRHQLEVLRQQTPPLIPPLTVKFFPPDSDPCFMVRA